MAATLTLTRFEDPEWTFERKLDGIRMLAFKNDGEVLLYSRNRLLLNAKYPDVVASLQDLPVHDAVLDGEATARGGGRAAPTTTSSMCCGSTAWTCARRVWSIAEPPSTP